MNRLNIEIVQTAIAEIRLTGVYPSFKAILKHVGYGSYSTLTKLKAQYPSVFNTPDATVAATQSDTLDTEPTTAVNTQHTDIDTLHTLINTEINTHFDALEQRFEQRFELLKSELLSELKKSSLDSVSSDKMNQTIVALKTENIELLNQLEKQASLIQKLTTDNNQLVLKNRNKFETIEQLQADIQRLEEAKTEAFERSKNAEIERDEALNEVIKMASENTELRSKLAISATEIESKSEPVDTTEPEQNDSKIEPENKPEIKFTLDEAHERFDELRDQFPSKTQTEYLRMLDAEGYKNSVGKKISPSNISRWSKQREYENG